MDNVQKHNNCAKHVGLPITHNPCPHINAELLLVSRMDNTMNILLCPLVWVLNNDATYPSIFEWMQWSMMRCVKVCIESLGGHFENLL
jgi:hypothetical protein